MNLLPVLLLGMLALAVAGGATALLLRLLWPRRHCPNCHAPMPRIGKPREMPGQSRGGWRCTCCDQRIDFPA